MASRRAAGWRTTKVEEVLNLIFADDDSENEQLNSSSDESWTLSSTVFRNVAHKRLVYIYIHGFVIHCKVK